MSLCCVFLTAFINTELVFHVVKIYTMGKTSHAVVSQYFIETMKKAGALLSLLQYILYLLKSLNAVVLNLWVICTHG